MADQEPIQDVTTAGDIPEQPSGDFLNILTRAVEKLNRIAKCQNSLRFHIYTLILI